MTTRETVAILDFGSQYTQLIARAIRGMGVYSVILPYTTTRAELDELGARGIILSGGPQSVLAEGAARPDEALLTGEIPVLGICYGLQLMAHLLGGEVAAGDAREYGRAEMVLQGRKSDLLEGLSEHSVVWMSHGDRVVALPDGFSVLARSEAHGRHDGVVVAIGDDAGRRFGVQFHPEVAHTAFGETVLANFVFEVCGLSRSWTPGQFIEEAVADIRRTVGDDYVILGVSGGVDSTVAAALIHEAIGEQLIPVFVDNGLLRLDERTEVAERFARELDIELHVEDASAAFLEALSGISDPEEKRVTIGHCFIDAFSAALRRLRAGEHPPRFLAQGTLYPDVIESRAPSGAPSAKIKTHHNVGGLPDDLDFELLEPLKWLFKDDVRRVGAQLGLSHESLGRHPFPGPGLGIRILGEVNDEALRLLRQADHIFISELRNAGIYDEVSQALAVLLPVRSVGVMGDARTYEQVVALRAVTTRDFMTADWSDLPRGLLAKVANRIINEVSGINRVVYDISSKPPATIEWE